MKVQNILALVFLFQVCLTTTVKKYQLEIKNGYNGSGEIVLTPGIFTRISLVLTSLDGDDFTYSDKDTIGYKLTFDDKNLVFFNSEMTMIPQENLVYTNFIGISCSNQINADNYEIPIKVEPLNSKTDEESIIYEDKLTVKINKVKTDIKLDLLLKSMAQKSQNFFQLENELHNVDDINISVNDDSISSKFDFKTISIASFAKRQKIKELEEISKENPANHGILFDYPFSPKGTLDSANFKLNLKIDGETNGLCFKLFKTDFNFELKTDGIIKLDTDVQSSIIYNTEDTTPKYDVSNRIKINTYIPIAPVVLECKFYLDSSFIVEDKSIDYEEVFKTVVTSRGKFDITMEHLNASAEYYVQCDISNTGIEETINKIKVLIGNFDGANVIRSLLPSRDPNAIPQCVTFTFDNVFQSKAFAIFGPLYCKYFMKKNDPLVVKALPTIICNTLFTSILDIFSKDMTLCAAPSPLYNTG